MGRRSLQAKKLIQSTKGKIFSVSFTKKSGRRRILIGRVGVKTGVTGTGLRFDPESLGYIPVFDMYLGQYRMVNYNTIDTLKIDGTIYHINRGKIIGTSP